MRRFGLILIVLGAAGFFYASSIQAPASVVGASLSAEVASAAGRMELLRYASAGIGFIGILLAMFPQGR